MFNKLSIPCNRKLVKKDPAPIDTIEKWQKRTGTKCQNDKKEPAPNAKMAKKNRHQMSKWQKRTGTKCQEQYTQSIASNPTFKSINPILYL